MSTARMREVMVLLGDPRLPDRTKPNQRYTPEDLEAVERLRAALAELREYRFEYFNDHARLLDVLRSRPPAFVLNFCDTGYRNEARRELHIPALLELLEIPYSGASPLGLGLCYDKALVRALAQRHGVAVPQEVFIAPQAPYDVAALPHPAFVKPNSADGSFGITAESLARTPEQARSAIERLRHELPDGAVLVQEFLDGAEYGVGLIGNPAQGFDVLPVLEVDYSGLPAALPRMLSYESKVDPGSPYWTDIRYRAATLDEDTRAALVHDATLMFERLQCRDYARVDFRLDTQGRPKLMEVNPNPAWCWDGKLNLMAGFGGESYADVLRQILEAAQRRVAAGRA